MRYFNGGKPPRDYGAVSHAVTWSVMFWRAAQIGGRSVGSYTCVQKWCDACRRGAVSARREGGQPSHTPTPWTQSDGTPGRDTFTDR